MSTTQSEPDSETEATDRTARHMRLCQRLAEIGIALFEATAERAMNALRETEAPQAACPHAPAPKIRDETPALARLSRIVQQAIALETRLTAPPRTARAAPSPALSDSRRAPLRRGLHIATEFRPDRKALRRQVETQLDQKLTEDPNHETAIYNLFMAICEEIGIKPDLGKIPDECLGFNIPSPADKSESEAPAFDVHSDDFFSYLRNGYPLPDFAKLKGAAASPSKPTGPI